MSKITFAKLTDPAGHSIYVNPAWVQTVATPRKDTYSGYAAAAKSVIEASGVTFGVTETPEEVVELLEFESE